MVVERCNAEGAARQGHRPRDGDRKRARGRIFYHGGGAAQFVRGDGGAKKLVKHGLGNRGGGGRNDF